MKYVKKLNKLFIAILLVVVYIFGFGLARCLLLISSKKYIFSKDSYWQASKKNSATLYTSPY